MTNEQKEYSREGFYKDFEDMHNDYWKQKFWSYAKAYAKQEVEKALKEYLPRAVQGGLYIRSKFTGSSVYNHKDRVVKDLLEEAISELKNGRGN